MLRNELMCNEFVDESHSLLLLYDGAAGELFLKLNVYLFIALILRDMSRLL